MSLPPGFPPLYGVVAAVMAEAAVDSHVDKEPVERRSPDSRALHAGDAAVDENVDSGVRRGERDESPRMRLTALVDELEASTSTAIGPVVAFAMVDGQIESLSREARSLPNELRSDNVWSAPWPSREPA